MSTKKDDRKIFAITPAQMRAARALLDWSQIQLSEAACVGVSTVKDAETGKRDPILSNIETIRRTLEDGGVIFLPANGDGPGVRLRGHRPEIIRRPIDVSQDQTLDFLVRWRDTKVFVQLPTAVLDALDETRNGDNIRIGDFSADLTWFRRNEQRILEATARAIEEKRFSSPGFIDLAIGDFTTPAPSSPKASHSRP